MLYILNESEAKTAFTSEKLEPSLLQSEHRIEEETKTGPPDPNSLTFLGQLETGRLEAYHPNK
jgi:hypothetical protein